jgi:hypothetical protein
MHAIYSGSKLVHITPKQTSTFDCFRLSTGSQTIKIAIPSRGPQGKICRKLMHEQEQQKMYFSNAFICCFTDVHGLEHNDLLV